jgi:NAD(P)-dependent dehydrogenase (short-subunit alcohol dehydrogenase family)
LGVSKGITVNTIAPGGVLTDPLLNLSDEALEGLKTISMEKSKAARRMGTVEDISDVVAFVAGEGSKWITGHVFPVGGGLF